MPKDFFTDPRFAPVQDALRVYLATMLRLSGVETDEARARGAAVYRYGKALAEVQWAPEELRDPERNYHSMTIEALESDIPDVPWKKMLDVLGAPDERRVIVGQPGPIADGVAVAMRTDIRVLRDATRIDLLDRYAEVLPTPFGEAGFALEQVLGGAQERPPLWKRGLWHVSGTAGDALGRLYVERHFPASSKAAVERMVGDIRAAFRERLASADWMDEPTRAEALVAAHRLPRSRTALGATPRSCRYARPSPWWLAKPTRTAIASIGKAGPTVGEPDDDRPVNLPRVKSNRVSSPAPRSTSRMDRAEIAESGVNDLRAVRQRHDLTDAGTS